jgi:hypothetical protein
MLLPDILKEIVDSIKIGTLTTFHIYPGMRKIIFRCIFMFCMLLFHSVILQRDTFYPQKLALTSSTSGGRSVGIVRLRTKATEFDF